MRIQLTILIVVNNDVLASASTDSTVRLYSLKTQSIIANLTGHSSSVSSTLVVSSNRIVTNSYDASVNLWDLSSGALIRTWSGQVGGSYNSMGCLSGGRVLVVGGVNGDMVF